MLELDPPPPPELSSPPLPELLPPESDEEPSESDADADPPHPVSASSRKINRLANAIARKRRFTRGPLIHEQMTYWMRAAETMLHR